VSPLELGALQAGEEPRHLAGLYIGKRGSIRREPASAEPGIRGEKSQLLAAAPGPGAGLRHRARLGPSVRRVAERGPLTN
jgi:hypothetical protein